MAHRHVPATPGRRSPLRATAFLAVALFAAGCDQSIPTQPMAPAAGASALETSTVDVIVGFAAAPGDAQAALIEQLGGRVTQRYRYIPFMAATIPAEQRSALAGLAGVTSVEDDHVLEMYGKQIVDWGVSKIEAPAAWDLGAHGQNVKVAIFDSGIDKDNGDLIVAGGHNLIPNSATDPTVDPNNWDDCNGHGTHVAGIVGATRNGNGTVGVAPKAQLYAIRFFDCVGAGATKSREIAGMEWAIDNGMDVVNMSFGCCTVAVNATTRVHVPIASAAEEAIMNEAYARGIVLIAASGNSSLLNGTSTNQPQIAYPAAYQSVVAVGATDDEDMLSRFSQWGDDQELTAPGVNNVSSFLVGMGSLASVTVNSDGNTELASIPLQLASQTGRSGIAAAVVFAGLGSAADFASVNCVGKIALVARGHFTFAEKTRAAQDAGCAAIIIHNNQPGNFAGTLGTPTDTARGGRAWLPGVSISLEDGVYLGEQVRNGPTTATVLNTVGNMIALSGTSMASPHATGLAALILSRNPALSPDQVRQVMRSSANDLGTPGWDPMFGYGRINARRAVQMTP